MKEKSYVMLKPGFTDEATISVVRERLEDNGFDIIKAQKVRYTPEEARQHYAAHVNKPFYPELEAYITSGPAYGMIVEGGDAIVTIRALAGATKDPAPGTIRHEIPGLLGLPIRTMENVIHSSDSEEAAKTEIAIFEKLCEKTNQK